ncbi:glycoside hydrolase family 2 TIM barrel-domain containing protein [Bacteroidota bacterium]
MLNLKKLIVFIILLFAGLVIGQNNKSQDIENIFILSDIDKGQIQVNVKINQNSITHYQNSIVNLLIKYPNGTIKKSKKINLNSPEENNFFRLFVDIDPVLPWHPKTPNLYTIRMDFLSSEGIFLSSVEERFGMRKLERRKDRFYVNNQPFFVRACGHEYESFLDSLDRDGIIKRLKQAKRYGFNAVRHHSHIPKEIYLQVADEVGIFLQVEIDGKIGTDTNSQRFTESKKNWVSMIKKARNHPSTFIYSMGNEIYGNDKGLIECQNILYEKAKTLDPSVLVLNRSGSSPYNDEFGKYDLIERPIGEYEHIAEYANEAFILYLRGDRKGRSKEFPIIAHEYPLVASYPNVELAGKYSEEPFWLKITRENTRKNGLEHLLPDFVMNSERIQALCRKEMLEEARKFNELDGYSMLRFTDCMQLVSGVVDDFSDPKNVTAEEFLRTNGETVLLCTWNIRNFSYLDSFKVKIEISHHGPLQYKAPKCRWWLMNGPAVLAKGEFDSIKVNPVSVAEIGNIYLKIPNLSKPAKLTLRADLMDTQPYINNEWYFWAFPNENEEIDDQEKILIWDPRSRLGTYLEVYPEINYIDEAELNISENKANLIITDSWNESFFDYLNNGGNIWIISDKSWPWPEEVGIFGLHITKFIPEKQAPTIFPEFDEFNSKWLTICSNSKSRYGNSGTVIYPHPALRNFPHEGFCDIHFWPMIYRAKSLQLELFPKGTEPIIRSIDNYYRGQSKGYMAELNVGDGKLFVSTLNITQHFSRDATVRYMFDQLLQYMTDPDWEPEVKITSEELRKMIDDFAVEISTREPMTRDEMVIRYETRWAKLISPTEMIIIPIYDAIGIDHEKLSVHYEYAQSQWFYNAQTFDTLTWIFSNESKGNFTGTIPLSSPYKDITLNLSVDSNIMQVINFNEPGMWEDFKTLEFELNDLTTGEHKLSISIASKKNQTLVPAIQIQDIILRAKK